MDVIIFLFFVAGAIAAPYNELGIIGGRNATKGEFPYIVSLQEEYQGKHSHFCGGAIINENWIVTASHCVANVNADSLKIYAGLIHFDDPNKQEVAVEHIFLHPGYSTNVLFSEHDIALIRLSSPLVFNELVQPIGLPEQDAEVVNGTIAQFAGWGAIYANEDHRVYPDYLKAAEFPLVDFDTCMVVLHDEMPVLLPKYNNSLVCAGEMRGTDATCNADSGGPLTQNGILIGTCVFGSSAICSSFGSIDAFTKVSSHVSWILKTIAQQQ